MVQGGLRQGALAWSAGAAMAKLETRRCGSCRWLLVAASECHRLPPAPGLGWPSVTLQASCGEWSPGSFADWMGDEFGTDADMPAPKPRWGFAGVSSAVSGIAGRVADSGRAAVAQASQMGQAGLDEASRWGNAVLATDFALQIDRHMRDVFGAGKATIYDKAMDANYIATHVGGGDHRLFDGGHDLLGAWQAVSTAAREHGDNFTETVGHYLGAIWKDMVTPKGLPVVTWDKQTFDQVTAMLSEQFGIAPAWVKDIATFTASELIGATISTVSAALHWNQVEIDRFASLVGSFGVSSLAGANPFLAVLSIICLARAFQKAQGKDDIVEALFGLAKGGAGTGAFIGASAAVAAMSGPAALGIVAGVVTGVVAHKAIDQGRVLAGRVQWGDISDYVVSEARRHAAAAAISLNMAVART